MKTKFVNKSQLVSLKTFLGNVIHASPKSIFNFSLATVALISSVLIYNFAFQDPSLHPFISGNFDTVQWFWAMIGPVIVLAIGHAFLQTLISLKSTEIGISPNGLRIYRGLLFKSRVVVPSRLVKKVKLKQSFFDRLFNRAAVEFKYSGNTVARIKNISSRSAVSLLIATKKVGLTKNGRRSRI